MSNPCVSVVMPVYNVERFVAAAINSVLVQDWPDFELIIVDDAGQDRSMEIVRGYADPRIRIISQANRGLAGARNTGISAARGRFVALLDSDDIWLPEKLSRHIAHFNADPALGASYTGAELIDEAGRLIGIAQTPIVGPVDARQVFCGLGICNGSVPVFRRETLEEGALPADAQGRVQYFDETLRRSEDVECWTRLALTTGWRFEGLPGMLTHYRVNAGGLSADIPRQLESWEGGGREGALLCSQLHCRAWRRSAGAGVALPRPPRGGDAPAGAGPFPDARGAHAPSRAARR